MEIPHFATLAARIEKLTRMQADGVVAHVRWSAAHNACDFCLGMDDKTMPIEEALEQLPRLLAGCKNEVYGYCRCSLMPWKDEWADRLK